MPKPIASLSLDLDNKWSYQKTHGDPGWESFPSYLDEVVPRILDILQRLRLRITVFVVGQDAALESNREVLSSLATAGHEVGNHSFHHEPWLHLYSPQQIASDIASAEKAIEAATGIVPNGFRGPGYSLSPTVIRCLADRGYRYDASTLPTIIGPLARAYYFCTARLTQEERRERRRLFGNWTDGFQRLSPYWWQLPDGESLIDARASRQLLEIPVTTLPLFRVPIHFSYLLFLWQFSAGVAWAYWRFSTGLCRLLKVEPSLLLHPLDFLGGDEEHDLRFFPAMGQPGATKRAFVEQLLADLARQFNVLPLGEHAELIAQRPALPVRNVKLGDADHSLDAAAPQPMSAAFTMEASRQ